MKDTLYLTFIVQKMSILNNDGLKCGIGRKVQKIVYIKRDINIEKTTNHSKSGVLPRI